MCYDVSVSNDFSDNKIPGPGPGSRPPDDNDPNKIVREPIHHQPVSARVPERVARGAYSTGQLVLDGPKEFVIDFLQGLTRPFTVNARVVLAPVTMGEFIGALQANLENYTRSFGPPPPLPTPQVDRRPTIQEIYENFKLSEDVMCGSYANSVLIGHSPTEFFFDFITGFYPTPAVSSRVLMPAANVPKFLNMLRTCHEQYNQRRGRTREMPGEGTS